MTFCLTEPTTSTNLVLWSKPKLELPIDARSAVLLLTVDTGYECNLASRSFTGRVVAGALAHCPLPSECGLNKSHNRYCNRVTNKQSITETCCQKQTASLQGPALEKCIPHVQLVLTQCLCLTVNTSHSCSCNTDKQQMTPSLH